MLSCEQVVDYTDGSIPHEQFHEIAFNLDKTEKQVKAIDILGSTASQIMLYGGTRSGKTVILLYAIIVRCLKCPGSRHLAARLRFSHAKTSIWHETLPFLLGMLPPGTYKENKSDYYIRFWNGSEIWVGGFDDSKRVEKLLGHEYSTIFFNEVSQIAYDTVILGLTRLAQNVGLENKAYFDCNPPSPMHWTHKLFIEGKDPQTGKPVLDRSLYDCLLMNPMDNLENLPKNYIERFLDILPEAARKRMKYGLFVKPEGMVYSEFEMTMVIPWEALPSMEYFCIGVDFGINMAAVLLGFSGDNVYLLDDYGAFNMVSAVFNSQVREGRGWKQYGSYFAYCDPAGGERIKNITGGVTANNSVDDGLDFIKTKMENGQFWVVDTCLGFLSEVWDYKRDKQGRIIKENDHYMDALRYGAYSFVKPVSMGKTKAGASKPITAGMRKEKF